MIVREYKKVREGSVKPSLAFIFLGKRLIMKLETIRLSERGEHV